MASSAFTTFYGILALSLLLTTHVSGLENCCPKYPSQLCDFYFDGYMGMIPTFHLEDGLRGDHQISPVSVAALRWTGTVDNFSPGIRSFKARQHFVNVGGSAYNGTFLECKEESANIKTLGQFYLTSNKDAVGKLLTRTWQKQTATQNGLQWYAKRCIKLEIVGASVVLANGTLLNLNVGDGNQDYIESRRCVIFKTAS